MTPSKPHHVRYALEGPGITLAAQIAMIAYLRPSNAIHE